MPSVGFLIHVPKLTEQYQDNVFLQMRALLDVCEDGLPLVEEEWYVINDHSSKLPRWKISPDERLLWQLKVEEMQDRCCHVVAKAGFAMKIVRPREISLNATIIHSEKWTTPKTKEECRIVGSFEKQVWDKIDQPKFIEALQNTCLILGATYACIDYEYFCPKSIYYGGFRFYGKKVPRYYSFIPGYIAENDIPYPDIDPEMYLPGVYWAQFVSQDMLESTGTLEHIADKAPCEIKKVIGGNGIEGVWLQLSQKLSKTPFDERLLLRRFTTKSLYELDLQRIADVKTPTGRLEIDLLPLEEEEVQQVEALRQAKALAAQDHS